jgi:hypothetical protein
VNANQVFSWRKHYGDDPHQPASPPAPQLIPVMITAEQDGVAAQPSVVAGRIEIHIGGRYRVCVHVVAQSPLMKSWISKNHEKIPLISIAYMGRVV